MFNCCRGLVLQILFIKSSSCNCVSICTAGISLLFYIGHFYCLVFHCMLQVIIVVFDVYYIYYFLILCINISCQVNCLLCLFIHYCQLFITVVIVRFITILYLIFNINIPSQVDHLLLCVCLAILITVIVILLKASWL